MRDIINIIEFASVIYLILYFWNDQYQILDTIQQGYTDKSFIIESLKYIRFLRILLILKILRLFSYVTYMKFIKRCIKKTFSRFIYNAMLLLLLMIIYAGYGFQLFSNMTSDRPYFKSYLYSFISVLQIITLDNWYTMFTQCYRSNAAPTLIFFISLIVLGNFILLNLFIALVLDGFENLSKHEEKLENEDFNENDENDDENNENSEIIEDYKYLQNSNFDEFLNKVQNDAEYNAKVCKRQVPFLEKLNLNKNRFSQRSKTILTDKDINLHLLKKMQKKLSVLEHQYKNLSEKYSLFIFSKKNQFRKNCFFFTQSPYFMFFINLIIILTSIKYGMDTFIDWNSDNEENSRFKNASSVMDFVIFSFYTNEAIMKCIAYGLFIGKDSYLRNFFNFVNFLNILSIVSHFIDDQTLMMFKVIYI